MRLAIEHVSQRENRERNDCLPANVAMLTAVSLADVLNRIPDAQRGRPLPIWHKEPEMMDLYKLLRLFGLPHEYSGDLNPVVVRGWLSKRMPVLLLIGYSGLGGYRQMDWEGDHYVTAVGYTAETILIHDPLGVDGAGSYAAVPDEMLEAAMRNMDWPGNRGNQGVVVKRPYGLVLDGELVGLREKVKEQARALQLLRGKVGKRPL